MDVVVQFDELATRFESQANKFEEELSNQRKGFENAFRAMEDGIALCVNLDELMKPDLTCPQCLTLFNNPHIFPGMLSI